MGLEKAIFYKKEHRKPFRGAARFDRSCRHNGGNKHWACPWCMGNRLHNSKVKDYFTKLDLKNYFSGSDDPSEQQIN